MANVEVCCEVSCPGARSRVRFSGSKRCTARKALWLLLVFGSDVRMTVRMNDSVTVRHG